MNRRAVFVVFLCGCGWFGGGGVHADDVVTWRAQPIIEIERHPLFSTLPRNVRELSDGSQLWDFPNCHSGTNPVNCTSNTVGGGTWANTKTTCEGGDDYKSCCHNQFLIRDKYVEEYRPVGNCRTDCTVRPGGVCK